MTLQATDVGGPTVDSTLKLLPWTDDEKARYERSAAVVVVREVDDPAAALEILQMLGIAPYRRPGRKAPQTPIKHGTRGGHVNRGCGKEGSDPCPASPTCIEQDRAYWVRYRATAIVRKRKSRRRGLVAAT